MDRWAWHIESDKRFVAFLCVNYADEIAVMMDIAPDYLAITRQTVEGTFQDWPANAIAPISAGQPDVSCEIRSRRISVTGRLP